MKNKIIPVLLALFCLTVFLGDACADSGLGDSATNGTDVKMILEGDYPFTDGSQDEIYYPVYMGLPMSGEVQFWNNMIKVFIANYELMAANAAGDPSWSVDDSNPGLLDYSWHVDDTYGHLSRAMGGLDTMPTQTGSTVLTVTCTWGQWTASKRIRVEVIQPSFSLPTGLDNLPDSVSCKVGETFTLAPTVLPAGWNEIPYEPMLFISDGLYGYAEMMQYAPANQVFQATAAGVYTPRVGLLYGTILMFKEVTFHLGESPATLELRNNYENINRYLGLTDEIEEQTGVFSWNLLADVEIPEEVYARMKNAYGGEPTWDVVQTSGAELPFTWEVERFDNPEWQRADFRLEAQRLTEEQIQPGDADFIVTCKWGGQTVAATVRVHLLYPPNGLPEGIDYNNGSDTVVCQVGDTLEIMPTVLPATWGGIPGYEAHYSGNSGEFEEFCDIIDEGDWGRKVKVTKAGIYQCFVGVGIDTVTAGRWITYRVADENGVVPVPTVELKLEQASQNVYLGLENYGGGIGTDSIGVWGEKGRFYVSFEGYQALTEYYHGSPRWGVRRKDTGEEAANIGDWYNDCNGDTGFLTCELAEVPDQPGSVTYEISVSWGDGAVSDTVEWTVNYISLSSVPAELDYPETVDSLEIGDTLRINPGMLPVGAEIPGYPWSVYLFGEQMDQFATRDDAASTPTEKVYTVDRAGVYAATVLMTADGVTVGKEVIFRIKDGTGEVPKPEIQVGSWNGMERNIYVGMGLEPGYHQLFSDSFVDRLYFENEAVLKKELSGEPEWTVTENGSPAADIGIRKDGYEAELYLKSMPAAAGDRTYEITCSWNGVTWTGTYTVRFRAAELPTKVRTDPEDGVVVMESGDFPPYGIQFDGWNQLEGEEAWQDMSQNLWEAAEEGKPGTYEGYMETGCANLVWREKMTIVIKGPDTQLAVQGSTDVNVYVGMPGNGLLAEGGSVWQDSMIIDLNVKPEDVMSHLDISPDPEWKIEQTGGKKLPITGGPESRGDSHRYLRYELEEIPKEEGEAVLEVTCKWGSDVCVTEMKVHCIKIEWPTGLANIDDTVETFVGETIIFEPEIAPAGWTVPGYGQERWGFDDEVDEFADCEPTRDSLDQINDRHTLTFKKAGTYSSTYVIVSDRVSVGREVTFHIRECPEWEFVLPEGTIEIGAFAFQNIAAESVRISSRCNKIGEGAFDGSQAKYFYVPASVTEIGENAFPEGACLYTTAGSPVEAWAEGRSYRVFILGE